MQDGFIAEFHGKEICKISTEELIQVLCYWHLDKEYDVDTLTRDEIIQIIINYAETTNRYI